MTVAALANFPHAKIGFSLDAHQHHMDGQEFKCDDCHASDITQFVPGTCQVCHDHINHEFLINHTTAFGADCLACHDGLDTYGSDFNHLDSGYPLEGKHTKVRCQECHIDARSLLDLQTVDSDCVDCHLKDDAHQNGLGMDCAECHNPSNWNQAVIDHDRTSFPLTGSHIGVRCQNCHPQAQYLGTGKDCIACHADNDVHGAEFSSSCKDFHNTENWSDPSFDHSLSNFPLTGSHASLNCQECHIEAALQKPSQECASCHADPAFHQGIFSADCGECHSTEAWVPARFEQQHNFPINHGENGGSTCTTCHPNSLSMYDCYSCHEHSQGETESKHREEGIDSFADCMRCHPTGQEHEGNGEREQDDDD